MSDTGTEPDLSARFLKLHLAHQKTLLGYFLASVRDFQLAEDLLQKTTLALWERYKADGEPASYLAWAFGVARRMVARHYRDHVPRVVSLSMDVLDQVASVAERETERLSAQSEALSRCVEKLPEEFRDLVRMRYEEGRSLDELARAMGHSLAAVNMKLVRIRRVLLDCSRRELAEKA